MTREEHMAWSKQRALQYLDAGDLKNALASMMSDLSKHDETRSHAGIQLTMMLMMAGNLKTKDEVRKHIEGFR